MILGRSRLTCKSVLLSIRLNPSASLGFVVTIYSELNRLCANTCTANCKAMANVNAIVALEVITTLDLRSAVATC